MVRLFSGVSIGNLVTTSAIVATVLLAGCAPRQHIHHTQPPSEQTISKQNTTATKDIYQESKQKIHKVAVILPDMAQQKSIANVAKMIRRSVHMATNDFPGNNLKFQDYQTNGTPQDTIAAIKKAQSNNTDIIIGPLLAPSVRAAQSALYRTNTPLIAFSNDRSLVGAVDNYMLAYFLEEDIKTVVNYAIKHRNIKNFAVLAPDNPYGHRVANAASSVINKHGRNLVKPIFYKSKNLRTSIQNLNKNKFDGLLLPGNPANMAVITRYLEKNGLDVRKTLLMGTGLWNDPASLKVRALQGAVFAAPSQAAIHKFMAHYEKTYQQRPSILASLGYDAVALLNTLNTHSTGNKPFLPHNFMRSEGFSGTSGLFRFLQSGELERKLEVMIINNGRFQPLVPAQKHF